MKILVGSHALKEHGFDLNRKYQSDIDYQMRGVGHKKFYTVDSVKVEEKGIPEDIFDYIASKSVDLGNGVLLPPIQSLYTTKCSHAQFDVHWNKTIHDISWYQQSFHNINVDETQFKMQYDFWLTVHKNNKHKVKLDRPKEKFFKDAVTRKFDHDSIHETVKHLSSPMYKYILKDGSSVLPDKNKFLDLDKEHKIFLGREEIFVVALERILIPKNFNVSPKSACMQAARNLVTTMTKGWYPRFIIENFSEISEGFNEKFVEKFHENKHLVKELS